MHIADFQERLERELKKRGWLQRELAQRAGMTPRHLSVTKNNGGEIPESFLKKICSAFEITPGEFLQAPVMESDYFPVPLRAASGSMGAGSFSGSKRIESYISLRKDFLLTKTSNLEGLSFIHAAGESMSPTIPPDAAVLIDESQTEPINRKIFYILLNGVYLIKRLDVHNGKVIALISDNGERREELGEQDDLHIIGRAILQQTVL